MVQFLKAKISLKDGEGGKKNKARQIEVSQANIHPLLNHVSVFPCPTFPYLKESLGIDSNLLHFTSMALNSKDLPEGFAGMRNSLLVF